MAISYVGGTTSVFTGSAGGSNSVSLTSLTGGSNSSPSINDLVVLTFVTGSNNTDRTLTVNTTGYVAAITEQYSNGSSTTDTNFAVFYKYLTAADTTISLGPTGNNADAGAVAVQVFRGVDGTNPLDVTAQVATGTGTGRPNPPTITPATVGAWIVACYGSSAATGAVYTAPSDVTNFVTNTSPDTQDAMVGMGTKTDWTTGAFDPSAVTAGGTTNAGDSWAAATLVLRPFIQTITANTRAFTFTGTPANLSIIRKIFADAGSYSVTGTPAGLRKTFRITADPGSYAQSPVPANLLNHRRITAVSGSYTSTGTPTNQFRKITGSLTPGNFAYTGAGTTSQFRRINGSLTPGSFAYTGAPTTKQTRRITGALAPGVFAYTGSNTTAQLVHRRITAVPGSYANTGTPATIGRRLTLAANAGTYDQTGINTDRHLIHRRMFADPGSYAQTGASTSMVRRIILSTASGVYTYAVPDETYLPNYKPTLLLCI